MAFDLLTAVNQAHQVGLEPTTSRLTAVRSTIELLMNMACYAASIKV